ncbi:hypothetical protein B0H63DRAFT_510155 [Podospora didyma]|uniref:Uncharacterized protein n=1 Tax=Podospora didyma TaxID=330526 RepID=A0AAE0NPV2_9PEZI|nr:hypothetical protein B0H63DRAFT_510155 [Podospora didyma]
MALKHLLTFSASLISAIVGTTAAVVKDRALASTQVGRAVDLYVWGNGIPGLQLFYANGNVYVSDLATANMTENMVPVSFTIMKRLPTYPGASTLAYSFTAAPNTTAGVSNTATRTPPFSNATLFVAPREGNAHDVGFVPTADVAAQVPATVTGRRMGGFMIDEGMFMVVEDHGPIHPALWCAFPTVTPGVWVMRWNQTNQTPETSKGVPVTLKTVKFPAGAKAPELLNKRCVTMQ